MHTMLVSQAALHGCCSNQSAHKDVLIVPSLCIMVNKHVSQCAVQEVIPQTVLKETGTDLHTWDIQAYPVITQPAEC